MHQSLIRRRNLICHDALHSDWLRRCCLSTISPCERPELSQKRNNEKSMRNAQGKICDETNWHDARMPEANLTKPDGASCPTLYIRISRFLYRWKCVPITSPRGVWTRRKKRCRAKCNFNKVRRESRGLATAYMRTFSSICAAIVVSLTGVNIYLYYLLHFWL